MTSQHGIRRTAEQPGYRSYSRPITYSSIQRPVGATVRRDQLTSGVKLLLPALVTHRRANRVIRKEVHRDGVTHGKN